MDIELTISGNLAYDPRLTHTRAGTPVCEMRVLVNRPAPVVNGERTRLEPRAFTVVVFNEMATRAAESLRKGDRVTVRSTDLFCEAWAHQNTGKPLSHIKVRASDIALSLRWRGATSTPAAAAGQDKPEQDVPAVLGGVLAS